MKTAIGLNVLMWVLVAGALAADNQPPMSNGQMSPEAIEKMMQKAEEMQRCMANVDQAELKRLEQRSYQFESEVKSLCAANQRSEAQSKAVAFGREISASEAMQTLQQCTEGWQDMVGQMPYMQQLMKQSLDYASQHVCDHL